MAGGGTENWKFTGCRAVIGRDAAGRASRTGAGMIGAGGREHSSSRRLSPARPLADDRPMPHAAAAHPETVAPTSTAPTVTAAPAPPATPAPSGGLTAEQMQTIQLARTNGRKVTRAARVATFSGWTMATFAAITLLSGLFSLPALLLGIGMAIVAKIELSARERCAGWIRPPRAGSV